MRTSVNVDHSLWREALVIPAYLAVVSAFLLTFQISWRTKRVQRLVARFRSLPQSQPKYEVRRSNDHLINDGFNAGFWAEASQSIKHQGVLPFTLKIMRFAVCIALVVITILAFVLYEEGIDYGRTGLLSALKASWGKHKKERKRQEAIHHAEWVEMALCAFYVRYE